MRRWRKKIGEASMPATPTRAGGSGEAGASDICQHLEQTLFVWGVVHQGWSES